MNPFSSGTRLRDMIRSIRACKTAAEERAVVRKECAAIRTSISENDSDYRHRNLAKLMFIHMLGYSTHFGQMECLKLIAAAGFPEKRIGYLGLMLLLDERQEVLMLVTNSLKQDLNHSNQYIVGLALCALGNICSSEMARDLAPEVERLLQFRDPNIRKKAALCSIRILRKVPDLAENFISPAASLLKEKHHGVLVTGIQLSTDLCKVSSEALEYFRKKCTEDLVRLLRDAVNSPYSPEYDVAGIMDPFLHVRLLQLLKMLGQGNVEASDCMNDILAQVATKTESNKNAGNAVLYECIKTIFGVEDNGGLRVLAINLLGRFLSNRDNNIRYVALNMLVKAITVDPQAVQRHRTTILECVKDADASIRKRALELVYLLVNETNYQHLTEELIDYLEVSDPEFKGYLTDKICLIVEKFLSEKVWYIDQMLKVLSEAGSFVKDNVWHFLIVVISRSPSVHGYTVRSLYKAARACPEQQVLLRVAVWCIGEYGDMLVNAVDREEPPLAVTETDAVDAVEGVMKHHGSDPTTHAMSMVALLKLSSRFPQCSRRIRELITEYRGNHVLELQQRSIEFNSIIDRHQKITREILERMPVLDEAVYSRRAASVSPSRLPNGISKSFAVAAPPPLLDLLDLSTDVDAAAAAGGGGGSVPPSAAAVASAADSLIQDLLGIDLSPGPPLLPPAGDGNGTDLLLDLLSMGAGASVTQPPLLDLLTPAVVPEKVSSVVAYESGSLRIRFDFSKDAGGDVRTCFIRSAFENLSDSPYADLVFQAAVPKFLQLHLEPASGNLLPPAGGGSVYQNLRVTNSQHGRKPLAMRIRVAYKRDGKDVLEEGQISNFPRDL